ncbi:TonB-dependent receptor [Polaribacter pectinis]|uniref:TonB-dependent receptor n=1 Tax=Polaribacter pectinis TaxID=2738844 RepID=A0A7G9L9X3_9FLAO|nr:TonB-dependent receptor [Polaribacter pectinis]QNM85422.1 TonB-dependent receptor [Polaribacter pectinis]
MKKFLFITFLALSQFIAAQNKGTLKGLLTDKETNNESLPFANVQIKGTTIGTTTDFDGNYILKVSAGNHIVVFSFLGYKTVEKSFSIKEGEIVTVNQLMSAEEGVSLDEIIVKSSSSKEKATALILAQKKSVSIKTTIGAQELSIKGVSDAEGAVTKTAGVSKGSKNVIVRGLGDRYNSTTLNGLPLPSEDPEYKNISLDFFDTSVIKNIGVNKVFTSEIYGDVGGANIDIVSKELIKKSLLNVGVSAGANTQTVSKEFLTINGTNRFGTQKAGIPVNDLTKYSFNNSWKPESQDFQLNNSLSFAAGKKYDINENTFSFFVVGGFDGSYNYVDGNIKQTTSSGDVYQDQDFKKYDYNVSQILMANLKYKFAEGHNIAYNHLFIHNNKQSVGDYLGFNNPEQDGDLEFQRRQQTNNNELYVNQFIANYKFSDRLNFEAKGSLNFIRGNEPDRRTNKYLFRDNFYSPQTSSAGENERYFSKLEENDYAAKGKFSYKLNKDEEDISVLEFGGDYRYTERLFSATIFNHDFSSRVAIDINNPDAVFNQSSIDNNIFELETGRGSASNTAAFVPFTYRGKRQVFAAFGNLVYQLGDNLIASVGGRFEKIQQRVTYNTNIAQSSLDGASNLDRTYVLPSFNVKYNFNENSIFRIAGSQSYTFPQFKETAPFKYQDVSFSSQGNPNLKPSDNYNFDAKYEYYMSSSELITLTGFYKYIQNPIARSEIPSGGNTLTYLNVGKDASVYGLEIEARKSVYKIEDKDLEIMAGLNTSILVSNVNLDKNSVAQFTNTTSNLEGATPFLMNADISINKKINDNTFISSIVFNYFSERVYSVGTRGFENVLEKGIPTLDLVSSYDFNKNFSVKLKATNLLNPDFQLARAGFNGGDNVVLRNYKKGVNLSLGFSYNF